MCDDRPFRIPNKDSHCVVVLGRAVHDVIIRRPAHAEIEKVNSRTSSGRGFVSGSCCSIYPWKTHKKGETSQDLTLSLYLSE